MSAAADVFSLQVPPCALAEQVQDGFWSYWGLYRSTMDGELYWIDDTGERLNSTELADYLGKGQWMLLKGRQS